MRRTPSASFIAAAVAAVTLVTAPAAAQEARVDIGAGRVISLDEALDIAARTNPDLRIFAENVEQAENLIFRAYTLLAPTVNLQAGIQWQTQLIPIANTSGQGSPFKLEERFPWAYNITPSLAYTVNFRSIPLLKQARENLQAAEYNRTDLRRRIQLAVATAYLNAATLKEQIAQAEQQLVRAREFLKLAEARLSAGVDIEVGLVRAQVEELNAQTAAQRARDAYRVAITALASLINVDGEFDVESPERRTTVPDGDRLQLAYSNRVDLRAREAQVRAARHAVTDTLVQWAPTITAQAAFTHRDQQVVGAFGILRNIWTVGVLLNWNIFDGGLRIGDRLDAESRERQAVLGVEQLRLSIRSDVRRAEVDLGTARNQLRLAERQRELALKNLDLVKKQYQQGLATNVEVIDAQTLVTAADAGLSGARLSEQLSALNLAFAVGRFDEALGRR